MAIAEYKTGTATISTAEYSLVTPGTTLASDTTAGIYQVYIDFANMAAGDEYNIEIREKVIVGGTQRTIYSSQLEGAQTAPFVAPTLILMNGWDVTVNSVAGTARSISWSIRQVA